ncbi:hypothetical protein DY000_02020397 [Brassica cretica]|uniref:Uncharacterized protein n=1 Tax=Brassica cretica TaxID=69181 RepID=A0ABQ7E471_BRACR|nr:hypothetical protein DY000_02020397 [Brassica cretica]
MKLVYMDELSPKLCRKLVFLVFYRRRNVKEEKKIVGEEEENVSKKTGLRRRHGY